jgi:hypothetical protein
MGGKPEVAIRLRIVLDFELAGTGIMDLKDVSWPLLLIKNALKMAAALNRDEQLRLIRELTLNAENTKEHASLISGFN